MCGIVGIYDLNGYREINRDLLIRMNESQLHRGPDSGGIHIESGIGLGHRRLSIIDLASGKQPMYSRSNSIVLTYNGEIYNFKDIKTKLESLGYIFSTNCDTEVIIYAWEAWGENCVHHFRGMFAFALWDRINQTLFLARDRLGVKPLYYTILNDGFFIFGSELKSLLLHPSFRKNIDYTSVEEYFAYGYIPDPKTIYKNVFKLAPGYYLTLRRNYPFPQPKQYWNIPFTIDNTITERQAIEELPYRLKEAVNIRRISDVPLGAFLSGGVDSSAIVAIMAGLSSDPVNTCSISFGDPLYNESRYAKQVADQYSTNHHTDIVDPNDYSLLDKLVKIYDEPFADSSALPTYKVCELARKSVIVALSGDGGDENFAGYRRYRWHVYEESFRNILPQTIRRKVFGFLGESYPKLDWAPKIFRAKSTFEAISRDSLEGYFHGVSVINNDLRNFLYSDNFKNELQNYNAIEVLRGHSLTAPTTDPLSLVQYLDFKTYLPGDILTKVDRASMAHALEVRVPFLDHKLVEWISTLSPNLKLNGRQGKYVLKKSLEPYLTNEILYRPKMGFSIPISKWFRGPLKESLRSSLLSPLMRDVGFFNHNNLSQLINQHQEGRKDHGPTLWALLIFESFLRQAI
jgi:asparagine synthase (glutamine-hydrolysing)